MSKLQDYKDRLADLEMKRRPWESIWQEISEYILPSHGFFPLAGWQPNYGEKRTNKIVDNTATRALRILAAGMQGGLTSPSRPWFRFGLPDSQLMQRKNVKEYLDEAERRMYWVFAKSNFYQTTHAGYAEEAGFGQMVIVAEQDNERVVNYRLVTAGQYSLAEGADGRVDTLFRKFPMTVRNLVKRFGRGRVTRAVRDAYDKNALDEYVDVVHVITPRYDRDPGKVDKRNMAWASCYFEDGASDEDGFLEESGFRVNPLAAPRWLTSGPDVYGRSPGMDVLPDVKMLQQMQNSSLRAIHKSVDPPVTAPSSLKGRVNMLPAGVTYSDAGMEKKVVPLYDLRFDINSAEAKIERIQNAISRGLFNDLFLMPDDMRPGVTAYEMSIRKQSQMMQLGPVAENQITDLLDPLINRTWDLMEEAGLLPPPPEELQGMEIKVEYISALAQAQKAAGTQSIQMVSGYIGQLAALNPTVVDKLNFDESVDQFGELQGVPAGIIRPDEEVAEIRESRAQQQAALAQQEMDAARSERALRAVEGVKTLSEVNAGNLSQMVGGGAQGAAQEMGL